MRRWAAALLCLLPVTALAGDGTDLDSIAGVYKHRFENALVDGTSFRSEDILEIVKVSDRKAYFRTHLEFYNGHMCTLWGVAALEHGTLTYHKRIINESTDPGDESQDQHCDLQIVVTTGKIAFRDADRGCEMMYCGARGRFDGVGFKLSARRNIQYKKLILRSREYADALEDAGLRP